MRKSVFQDRSVFHNRIWRWDLSTEVLCPNFALWLFTWNLVRMKKLIARPLWDLHNLTSFLGGLRKFCCETVFESFLYVWKAPQKIDFRNIFPWKSYRKLLVKTQQRHTQPNANILFSYHNHSRQVILKNVSCDSGRLLVYVNPVAFPLDQKPLTKSLQGLREFCWIKM